MPTKKSAKRRATSATRALQRSKRKDQIATSRVTSARSTAQSASVDATIASLEAQMASIEEQIALLKEEGNRGKGIGDREEANPPIPPAALLPGVPVRPDNSALSPIPSSLSPRPSPNSTATFLQTWLDELQVMFGNFSELVPELGNTVLDTTDRRRLLGSGVRRYGFIEKTADVAEEYPQFWPAFVTDTGELKERVDEIEVLRNLLVWFRYASRIVGDLLLVAGDDAFRLAGSYYATARDGARRKVPEAMQVFQLLQLFWKHPRRMTEEPTMRELERDFNALMHGTKDGQIAVANESPHVSGGMREVVDNVQRRTAGRNAPCTRGGVKVVEEL